MKKLLWDFPFFLRKIKKKREKMKGSKRTFSLGVLLFVLNMSGLVYAQSTPIDNGVQWLRNTQFPSGCWEEDKAYGIQIYSTTAVSYTHLTLPTICSV